MRNKCNEEINEFNKDSQTGFSIAPWVSSILTIGTWLDMTAMSSGVRSSSLRLKATRQNH